MNAQHVTSIPRDVPRQVTAHQSDHVTQSMVNDKLHSRHSFWRIEQTKIGEPYFWTRKVLQESHGLLKTITFHARRGKYSNSPAFLSHDCEVDKGRTRTEESTPTASVFPS
eukprot:4976932-Amphidinium_carterae.4